jgi:hypothetical protein
MTDNENQAERQEEAQIIADIIMDQLGGARKLRMMIGMVQYFFGLSRSGAFLQFDYKMSRHSNKARITLNGSDTYTVEFYKGNKLVLSKEYIYGDMLISLFEKTTGLYLSL